MAGKIRAIWEALSACFKANDQPLTTAQVLAWVGVHYKSSDFHPSTLKAQLYRSCANVPSVQTYKAPKILYYDKRTRTYTRFDGNLTSEIQDTAVEEHDEDDNQVSVSAAGASNLLVGVEAELRDYLAANLSDLEAGLVFWNDSPPSVEFPIDGRRIDILAKDGNGNPVVIELKRHKAYDRVVGQALLYQALVAAKFNTATVRVMLVASEIADELRMACSRQKDFGLFEYELKLKLKAVSSNKFEDEEA